MAGQHKTTEFKHGTMDTKVQQRTFEGFIRAATWVAGLSFGILIFLALANS